MTTGFTKSYALGLLFLLGVGIIWAAASVLMQHIYDDMNFRSPFFLTFLTNSLLMIYLPLWQVWILLGAVTKKGNCVDRSDSENKNTPHQEFGDIINDMHENEYTEQVSSKDPYNLVPQYNSNEPTHHSIPQDNDSIVPYTHLDVMKVALVIAPLYVLSNGLYNYSLFMTSVSSSTIISNLSGTFTFAFSWYLGLEVFTYTKVFGILACFMGAVCVGLNDSKDGSSTSDSAHTVAGDSVALLGALFYGLYTTVLKYMIPDDDGISMQLLLGYVGLINVVCLAPILIILYLAGTEHFAHLTGTVFWYMVISGLFNNVISDYLWARSVVLTSSTVATVGLSITIPMAMVADFLVHAQSPTGLSSGGAILVVVGFCLVNISKETEVDMYMYMFGGKYERITKELALNVPIKCKTSEVNLDDMCI